MGLFGKKQEPTPVQFTRWPDPALPEYGLQGADLHQLDLKRDGMHTGQVAGLFASLDRGDYELLGRVSVVGDRLVVECWGQVIGEIETAQARSWGKRITSVGGTVWCVLHIDEWDGVPSVRYVQIDKRAV